jgi:hypothetical protein
MEFKAIIQEIERLPLSKKFLIMEQTLKYIKREELEPKSNPEKEQMIARALKSEQDIKAGRVYSLEEAEKRLGLA